MPGALQERSNRVAELRIVFRQQDPHGFQVPRRGMVRAPYSAPQPREVKVCSTSPGLFIQHDGDDGRHAAALGGTGNRDGRIDRFRWRRRGTGHARRGRRDRARGARRGSRPPSRPTRARSPCTRSRAARAARPRPPAPWPWRARSVRGRRPWRCRARSSRARPGGGRGDQRRDAVPLPRRDVLSLHEELRRVHERPAGRAHRGVLPLACAPAPRSGPSSRGGPSSRRGTRGPTRADSPPPVGNVADRKRSAGGQLSQPSDVKSSTSGSTCGPLSPSTTAPARAAGLASSEQRRGRRRVPRGLR